jgi:ketosteroid isomerase-like protein
MSQENVDLVRRGYEALARGDFDALFQVLDPDVEIRDAANFPEAGVYRGRHHGISDSPLAPRRLPMAPQDLRMLVQEHPIERVEAPTGIEPVSTALQAAA